MTKFKIKLLVLLQRIISPWSLTRVLFVFIGFSILYQASIDQLWIGMIFGAFFMSKGIFAIGCAGANCHATSTTRRIKLNKEVK